MEIQLRAPERMNLLGYFLREILQTNLTSKKCQRLVQKLKGAVLFDAGGMQVTLVFRGHAVEIVPGAADDIISSIQGELNTLLDVALGANYLKFVITGKIRIRGNLLTLLRLIPLLRIARSPENTLHPHPNSPPSRGRG